MDRLRQEGIQALNKADFTAAQKAFWAGLEKAQSLRDERRTANFLNGLGRVYTSLGQFDKALEFHSRSLALREKLGNEQDIASSLNNLGRVYGYLGQMDKALDFYTRALQIRQKLGNQQDIAGSLNNLGNVYDGLGQMDKALEFHSRALTLHEKLGNQQDIAGSLANLGNVYGSLGQFDKALDFHNRALVLFEKLGNQQYVAHSLDNLGIVYERLGQMDKALEFHSRALTLHEKLGNQQDIAYSLDNLGIVYTSLGQLDKALEFHSRALVLFEKLGNQQYVASSLDNLGIVYTSLGQLDKALDFHNRALALRQKLGNEQHIAGSLNNLGNVHDGLGQLDKARQAFAQALRHHEAVSEQIGDATQLGAYQEGATEGNLYGRYAWLQLRLKQPDQALETLERGRAQGLARQVAQNQQGLDRLLAPHDAKARQQHLQALAAAEQEASLARRQAEPAGTADKGAAQSQLAATNQRHEAAERRLAILNTDLYQRYPKYRRLRGAEPPTALQLTALARRNPDTLYLQYALVDDKSALLVALSHKDGLQGFTLPVGNKALAKLVEQWRAGLSALGDPDWRLLARRHALRKRAATEPKAAKALAGPLLAPLEKAGLLKPGRYARLVVVTDGPLLDVPFAALVDPASGKRLVERYAVSGAASLGVLLWPKNERVPSASLLCAVDPTGTKAARFSGPVQVSVLREGFQPLQHARAEAKAVTGLFAGAVGLAGSNAREAQVKEAMPKYGLLHFATHGILDASRGLRSWLLLAEESSASAEDGRLEAREIVSLPLSAQLAVLSACESGRGQRSGGEGLLGLTWAFRAAGCPSVVASQWKVDDAATSKLMVSFYKQLKAGKRKDDALRAAMLALKKDPRHATPFYWAAFQLIGDTSPISVAAAKPVAKSHGK